MTGKTWLGIALAISLLFNLAALGAAARLWHLRQDMSGSVGATLPRAMQRELAVALSRHRAELAPSLADLRAKRAEAVAAATATPFDRAKAEAALDALRASVDQLMVQAQGIALDTLDGR